MRPASSLALIASFGAALALPQAHAPHGYTPYQEDGHWVNTWSAMPQLTEYTNLPLPPFVSFSSPREEAHSQ